MVSYDRVKKYSFNVKRDLDQLYATFSLKAMQMIFLKILNLNKMLTQN